MANQTTLALDFLDRARQFRRAYELLRNVKQPPVRPQYSLFYHAIELTLKAYLLQQGVTPEDLNEKFSHDTKLLVNEAIKLGLSLPNGVQEFIATLSEPIENLDILPTQVRMRYPPNGPVYSLGQFDPYMFQLCEAVAKALDLPHFF